jgi:hypothetical protein
MQSWLFTANPAGGTVTIVSTPTDPSFQLTDLLIDPNGNTIGAATGAAPGDIVDLLNVPLSLVGTYTIIVGGFNNTTGGYQLHVTGSTDASIHSLLPEPSSWILVLSALTMLAFLLRQRSGSMVRRPRARA